MEAFLAVGIDPQWWQETSGLEKLERYYQQYARGGPGALAGWRGCFLGRPCHEGVTRRGGRGGRVNGHTPRFPENFDGDQFRFRHDDQLAPAPPDSATSAALPSYFGNVCLRCVARGAHGIAPPRRRVLTGAGDWVAAARRRSSACSRSLMS